jgi:hypothetical protein
MPTAVISGFVPSTSHPPAKTPYPADTIDLVDVPYDGTRSGIATFYAGGNSVQPNGVLKIAQNGSTLILQLGSGLIDQSQKATAAAMQIADR